MSRTIALLLALSSLFAAAQSFDCKLAQSPREKAVCADTRLSALDAEIAANYKSLRAQLSPESAALVQSDQREWLHWIDLVCPAHGKGIADDQTRCLQNEYFTRAHDLEHATPIGDTVIFLRSHFLFKPGKATKDAASNDPGFGFGSLRWPQIDIKPDHPNAAYTAWNDAIKTQAAKRAVGFSQDKNATFDTAVDTSGTIEAYYTIEAANDRLIITTLIDGTYGWGAAHPLTDNASFPWWLDRNRPLTVTDVFLPSTAWQEALVPAAIERLKASPGIKDMLWEGDELQKAVFQGIVDPTAWTLTRDGLTVTFGQYAVAAYAAGMPQVHFTWDELQPYLEPTLNPSTLPAPIPKPNP